MLRCVRAAVKYEVRVKGSDAAAAASPAEGAEFSLDAAPLRAFATALPTMVQGDAVHLAARSDCEPPRLWLVPPLARTASGPYRFWLVPPLARTASRRDGRCAALVAWPALMLVCDQICLAKRTSLRDGLEQNFTRVDCITTRVACCGAQRSACCAKVGGEAELATH